MDEGELALVTGQTGVTIYTDIYVNYTADVIKISDSDLINWLEFQNVSIHDGSGMPFNLKTPDDTPISIDVGSLSNGQTVVQTVFSQYTTPRYYSINNIVFCDTVLGSLDIDHLIQEPSTLLIGSHADGSQGVDFQYSTSLDMDMIEYSYNDAGAAFSLKGIHLYGSAAGDPETPETWTFSDQFQIGEIETNPGTIDIATNETRQTTIELGMSMQGTLRIEDINFSGTSFGPCAIDGLNVHRLTIRIDP